MTTGDPRAVPTAQTAAAALPEGGAPQPVEDARPGLAPLLVLLGATLIWGSTFVVTKDALVSLSTWSLLTWRMGLAATALVLLAGRRLATLGRRGIWRAMTIGALLGTGFGAQTVGLTATTPATNGFVTGLMVVLAPLVAWLVFRRHFRAWTWIAVAMATAGLWLMSGTGGADSLVGIGYTVLGAALFAGQIATVSQWAADMDPLALTAVQVTTAWLVVAAFGIGTGSLSVPRGGSSWLALGYLALVATVLGLVAQVWAQARMSAARAAVVMTMEPVFAGIFAVAAGQALTARLVLGGAVIVAAMLLVELTGSSATAPTGGSAIAASHSAHT